MLRAFRCLAVAEAFSTACAKGDDVKVEDFDDVFKSEDAFAFAKVRLRFTFCRRSEVQKPLMHIESTTARYYTRQH